MFAQKAIVLIKLFGAIIPDEKQPAEYRSSSWADSMQDMIKGGSAGELVCIDQAYYQAVLLLKAGVPPEKIFVMEMEEQKEGGLHSVAAVEIEGKGLLILNNRSLTNEETEKLVFLGHFYSISYDNVKDGTPYYFGPQSDYILYGMRDMTGHYVCFTPDHDNQKKSSLYTPDAGETVNAFKSSTNKQPWKEICVEAALGLLLDGRWPSDVIDYKLEREWLADTYGTTAHFSVVNAEFQRAYAIYNMEKGFHHLMDVAGEILTPKAGAIACDVEPIDFNQARVTPGHKAPLPPHGSQKKGPRAALP